MPEPILAVSGLQKRIGGRTIVHDITFELHAGEILGFLGPNGAGKTTIIRMLVGLIRPTSGKIMIDGHNLLSQGTRAMKRMGCIVENPDLYPYLTGYENLLQLARMQGAKAVSRIEEVVDRVSLSARIHDPVRTYSLGMRQRLGIAQALLCQPKLLILDEPTNGLDPAGIRELRDFLHDLAAEGMGIFVSSHLLSEIQLLCHTVAMLKDGAMVRSGRIDTLLSEQSSTVRWHVSPVDSAVQILQDVSASVEVFPDFIRTTGLEDDIPAVVHRLVQSRCLVHQVVQEQRTLEDVFLETTGRATE